ncbi:F-box protein AUF2-like [Malania oleifera]|uniref:F-box protein AUF2-like n=1 Tax=Malania oleifera TaxID=397392 RepID=UPI0025AE5F52|nr:F-box protein AUF2-like [Malania oleifera]
MLPAAHACPPPPTDYFDRIPDSLIILIFNSISDIKTLIRCRAVSKRFNSLVPQAETLSLRVDCVISAESDDDSFLVIFLRSIMKSLHDFICHKPDPIRPRSPNSPAQILRNFHKIRELEIELPAGDLKLEKGAVVKWKAEFGRSLRSCVILGFHDVGTSADDEDGEGDLAAGDGGGGLKIRVVWTISALIAASARHYLLKEVVREHREMERLVLRDRETEGTLVMEKAGLREWREAEAEAEAEVEEEEEEAGLPGETAAWRNNRTTVPAVRMRMRHEPWLALSDGVRMEGATLVVVRPIRNGGAGGKEAEAEDGEVALGAFEGVFGEAVQALLKSRSYLLEMNSF